MTARWLLLGVLVGSVSPAARAGDWPQWRGPNRDARVTGFKAPKAWPKELTQKWKIPVGDGVATPALVGDKLYVFTRQGGKEILRCLDANSGSEVWKDEYETGGATGPASSFSGPRCSPAVAEGKVVTLGVRGILSCYDAAKGTKLWRKDDFKGAVPRFFTSSSPIVADGLCVAELGGEGGSGGGIVAYELATGNEKWKWTDEGGGPAYASPVLLAVDGTKAVVAEMSKTVVAVGLADGKLLWQTPFGGGRGRTYNAATPMVDGQTVIYSGAGRGTMAVGISKQGDKLEGKELWKNPDTAVQFNSPVVKDGLVYGITDKDALFCVDAKTGKTAWTTPLGGGGGRSAGYGSVVDLGPVLVALSPAAKLVVFEPGDKEYKQVASYKVADGGTYAYPVVAGNRIYIKDRESLTLWTIE